MNRETKFTQGPWELRESGLIISTHGNTRFVARVESHAARLGEELTPQDMANGRLIAAAPELREAAKMAARELSVMLALHPDRDGGKYRQALDALDAALALVDGPQKET